MKILVTIIAVCLIGLRGWETAPGNDAVEITEWTVHWQNTCPRDLFVDTRNRVWFVGQTVDYIAFLSPQSGQFTRYDLEPGMSPHNLVVDRNGQVWYAGTLKSAITEGLRPPPSDR
jgi:streptogramin lyase